MWFADPVGGLLSSRDSWGLMFTLTRPPMRDCATPTRQEALLAPTR